MAKLIFYRNRESFSKKICLTLDTIFLYHFYQRILQNSSHLCPGSNTLSITLSNVHLRLEDFPKNDFKVVVLFYPSELTIVNLYDSI